MKTVLKAFVFVMLIAVLLSGCGAPSSSNIEHNQQETGIKAILQNQPVPDLGGWSFERQVLIDTYIARNKMVNTYTYLFLEYTGKIVKICDSKGYPIPYSTELTNPTQVSNGGSAIGTGTGNTTIGNPEPSGLYPPPSANATLVQCVLNDGQVVPTYWENNVFALPYEVQADIVLTPTGKGASFSINIKK